MIEWLTLLAEVVVMICTFFFCKKFVWKKFGRAWQAAALLLYICAVFAAFSGANIFEPPKRTVTVTALNGKSDAALESQIYLTDWILDGETYGIPDPVEGQWSWANTWYCWFEEGDERREDGTTQSVTFELPVAWETEAAFWGNRWKGIVEVETEDQTIPFDTHTDQKQGGSIVKLSLPHPSFVLIGKAVFMPFLGYDLVLLLLCTLLTLLISVGQKVSRGLISTKEEHGPLQRILRYQFLFEELVKRDFKKKYKRTVLGMLWSVLSPLLTLLVMRLVFTQFFGRTTAHYTVYLFCGNLIFSYFNESTSQGMTALVGNSGIFSKVNMPKYMFLFSKNVQTLINFGLTLCVFFVFCIIDQITFTWKFICLLYPIVLLLLFNIGMGLILSALFVFFKDIQYLWSVFTMLLMYMSAIFYTIDSYSPEIQNLFLLNPVYLFIRYFRKIVIEATIPTVWFHLLMLADAVAMLGLGCWMYRKYNTKFLYYV